MTNNIKKISKSFSFLLFSLIITACSQGDRGFIPVVDEPAEEKETEILITGGAVKGPLINAEINIYKLELDQGPIYHFNNALSVWFDLLNTNQVQFIQNAHPESDTLILGTLSAQAVVNDLQNSFESFGFVTELEILKKNLKKELSYSSAVELIEKYISAETNTNVANEVNKILAASATLNELKEKINELESLTDKLLESDSFSDSINILNTYKATETNTENKLAGYSRVLGDINRLIIEAGKYSLSVIQREFRHDVYDVFFSDFSLEADPSARQNLISLKEKLDNASSVIEAETLIKDAHRKEGNELIKSALSKILSKIITIEDFHALADGYRSIYQEFTIRDALKKVDTRLNTNEEQYLDSLIEIITGVNDAFTSNFEIAFRDSLIIEDDEGEATNILSYGVSNSQGLLPGLNVGEYRGFVYMEALSSDRTIDLNTGTTPIFKKMETIFHTDDILGNGNNAQEDETIYFVLNGVVQRNSDGELITDSSLIETTTTDKLLLVRPSFFATPFTNLAIGLTLEKLKNLNNINLDSNQDLLPENRINESLLKSNLETSSKTVSETFGIGLSNPDVFNSVPVRLAQMQYSQEDELEAIQQRLSIENYSAFFQELMSLTNLTDTSLLELLIDDLNDGQIDGFNNDLSVPTLSSVQQLEYMLSQHPSERMIPGTTTPVSNIYYLMNKELSTTLPNEQLSLFPTRNADVNIISAKGGVDSDQDGVLDHDDQFPFDPNKSRDLNAGYSGIWSVNVDNSETGYMPFNNSFTFDFNLEQIEGECIESPCIGLGDISSPIIADFSLISAPSNNDFVFTKKNESPEVGFEASASMPGNYLVKATLSTDALPKQTYSTIIPIQVIDPRSIEIKFDPEEPQAGKTVSVLFKATKGICSLYTFCSELGLNLNDDIDDFVPLSLLSDIFSVEQKLNRNDNELSYSSVTTSNLSASNLSNIEIKDDVNITVKFNAGSRSFNAASFSNIVGSLQDADGDGVSDVTDVYPLDNLCSQELDGILDTNFDGQINSLDSAYCFETIRADATATVDVSFLNETWLYNPNWHFIIRANSYSPGYKGYIQTPTLTGTKAFIESFKIDAVSKRVYFAYKNGAIDFFSLEEQTIQDFSPSYAFNPVNSLHLLGTYLLVEYTDNGITKLFNKNAQLAHIHSEAIYPYPGNAITLQIDKQNLASATNSLFSIYWSLERETTEKDSEGYYLINQLNPLTSNNELTLNSGQTVFGDVAKVTLNFTTDDNRTITVQQNIFVLGIEEITFSERDHDDKKPLTLKFDNFNSAVLPSDNSSIFVKWYKNNTSTEDYTFALSDKKYPFAFEEGNFELGDMIRSVIYIQHGSQELEITRLEAVILGNIDQMIPRLDSDISYIDGINRTVNLTLLKPLANDKFFNLDTFQPVWKINQQRVPDEGQLYFPSLSSTTFSYGDIISVTYKYNINGITAETAELVVEAIDYDQEFSKFSFEKEVFDVNQDISLKLSEFTDSELDLMEARWRINGVIDETETSFSYPASKLNYGDNVELLLLPLAAEIDRAYTHIASTTVGVNLNSLLNNVSDPENDLDSDQDGIPNHLDYFRNDAECSLKTDGHPDDIDSDGVSDLDELKNVNRTSPLKVDTDNDGLSDFDEIYTYFTNPTNADSDGDGYSDGVEIALGSLPNDPSVPDNTIIDNDFDGLSNDLELLNNTKVNVFDTDNDGLSDWYEINVSTTDPLNADSDGDKLSDGAEINITQTNPNLRDSDGDGIDDGIEVALKLDPNDQDTDKNGVLDIDEPGYDFNINITAILYPDDLKDYDNNFTSLLSVPQGTCFKTWLANRKPSQISSTHEEQVDSSSKQELAFAAADWAQVIRFNAQANTFSQAIDISAYNAHVSSISYDVEDANLLYIGFSDGKIRQYNSLTNTVTDLFNTNNDLAIATIINQDDILIAEQLDDSQQIIQSVFSLVSYTEEPVFTRISNFSYKHSIWTNSSRNVLISFDSNYSESSFIKETFNSALQNPFVSEEVIALSSTLDAPLFIEELSGKTYLHFGSGDSYNLTDSALFPSLITPFEQGFEHQGHRVLSQKNSSFLELTTLSEIIDNKYWRFNTQLLSEDLISVVPVGYHLLAISSTEPTNLLSKDGKISFQTIILGDENADTLPDWWTNLSENLTLEDYQNYELSSDALIPDLLDGTPNVDNSITPEDLFDTDGDNICDHWEVNLFNTNPLSADTDSDGRSDSQELNIQPSADDCSVYPNFTVLSDPLNPDSDADGILDGAEVFTYGTNPLNPDSDNDGLTDYQELFTTNTNPNNNDTSGDGTLDGNVDSDLDGLSDAQEINFYHTNYLSDDSDSDGLNDYDEVFVYGTNPNDGDSDGDDLTDLAEITIYGTDGNSIDTDNDGVPDPVELNIDNELEFSSDPTVPDTDGDGLSDLVEYEFLFEYSEEELLILGNPSLKSNPNEQDSDGDGICDKWEVLNFNSNPAEADTDGDGLSDAEELGITSALDCTTLPETSPISFHLIRDSDNDRILDGDEVLVLMTDPKDKDSNDNGLTDDLEDPDQDGLNNYQELYQTQTDPLSADTNNNGITDDQEDSDGDGLSNIDELNIYGTNPLNPDSDDDGINDKDEIDAGLNPTVIDTDDDGLSDNDEVNIYGTDPTHSDTDRDGSSDYVEVRERNTDPNNPDSDNDFLLDSTDDAPLQADRDGDGIPDGIEVHYLRTYPNEANSDSDSLADNYEAWVFAYAIDSNTNAETNTLVNVGANLDTPLNSNRDLSGWPELPEKFAHNNLDQLVYDLVDVLDSTIIKGRLYIKRYSNPTTSDSDGDGLLDSTEFEIERVQGVHYTKALLDANFDPQALNSVNFKVSDPWNNYTGSTSNSVLDTDNDGISDFYEINYTFTDPNLADTDGDGILDSQENEDLDLLNNLQEILYGSDPRIFDVNLDTDGDGILDVFEINLFENYDINSTDSDSDGIPDGLEDEDQDLLTNLEEIKFKTDPLTKDFGLDSDGDGLSDYQEINITETDPFNVYSNSNGITDDQEDPDGDFITNLEEFILGGNPLVVDDRNNIADSDNDGLTDFQELNLTFTNHLSADSDGDGINDSQEDLDSDGLTNFQEMKLGTDPLVFDSHELQKDTDDDGLVDIYELKITNTDPNLADTNADGILDGQGDTDNDGLTDFIEILLGTNPTVKNIALDSDGDGLTDTQELFITLTDKDSSDSNSNGILDGLEDSDLDGFTNLQEMVLLTSPHTADISDAFKDTDNDLLNNLKDQNSNDSDVTAVTTPDQDNDGLLDGLEVLLFGTDPLLVDTDNDGLTDQAEIYALASREVANDVACLDTEVRLSSIAGKNYCFTITYNSYPTLADSDNDGVADRSIDESDNSIILDHYPLDASCNLLGDGFIKADLSKQCFSSWMAEFSEIEIIKHAQWTDTSDTPNINHADILFYSSTWDSIVVHNALSGIYNSRISIKDEINSTEVSLVDFEFNSSNKQLYLLYSDGTLDSYNMQTGIVQTLGNYVLASHLPKAIKLLNTNKLLLQMFNEPTFSYVLINTAGTELASLQGQVLDIEDSALACSNINNDCSESVGIYGLVKNTQGQNINIGLLDLDLINNTFGASISQSSAFEVDEIINGPLKLSLDKQFVQLGSGQVLDLVLADSGKSLSINHNNEQYQSYYDFVEYADHFVGVVDVDLSGVPGSEDFSQVQNGLLISELDSIKQTIESKLPGNGSINDLKTTIQYLLPPTSLEEQVIKLIPFAKTPSYEMAIVKKSNNKINIVPLGLFDEDNDLMTGLYEKVFGLDDTDANDKFTDLDADGLSNIEEYFFATDPSKEDTDDDGWSDLIEILNGTDPNNSLSY